MFLYAQDVDIVLLAACDELWQLVCDDSAIWKRAVVESTHVVSGDGELLDVVGVWCSSVGDVVGRMASETALTIGRHSEISPTPPTVSAFRVGSRFSVVYFHSHTSRLLIKCVLGSEPSCTQVGFTAGRRSTAYMSNWPTTRLSRVAFPMVYREEVWT